MKKASGILIAIGFVFTVIGTGLFLFCVGHGATGWSTRWGNWEINLGTYGVSVGPLSLFNTGHSYETGKTPTGLTSETVPLTGKLADFSKLELDLGVAETRITQDGGEGFLTWTNFPAGKLQYQKNGDTLTVTEHGPQNSNLGANHQSRSLVINLPPEVSLAKLKVENGVGTTTLTELTVKELDFSSGVGELIGEKLLCTGSAVFEGGVGDMDLDGDFRGPVTLSTGTGEISLKGTLRNDLTVDSGVGDISIDLRGSLSDYRFDIDGGMGDVTLNGNAVKREYRTPSDAASYAIHVGGGLGDVDITIE